MDGFMGRVELGSKAVSQFPAGKSYQGVVGSPCIAGMMNGGSFTTLVVEEAGPNSRDPFPTESLVDGPCSTAARSVGMTSSAK